ncbi:MAG: reverse transcriptase family protein [Candidatus Thiodiazotropha sp.]
MQFDFERNNILTDCQQGFRKRRSCETQLILTINDLARGQNAKQQIGAVLLDFSKAFDRVPHQRLLLKLNHYGVRGNILRWTEDFVSARTQEVIIEGSKSSPLPVTSGVPQGTVLSPLLFLAYINDMPKCVQSEIKLFADDSLLYRRVRSSADCHQLQEDLDKLQEWEQKWQMAFNADNCEVIRITNKKGPFVLTTPSTTRS